jgi:hypothetical protein
MNILKRIQRFFFPPKWQDLSEQERAAMMSSNRRALRSSRRSKKRLSPGDSESKENEKWQIIARLEGEAGDYDAGSVSGRIFADERRELKQENLRFPNGRPERNSK